jgi:tetratricopeptide (TPR) repeat protein
VTDDGVLTMKDSSMADQPEIVRPSQPRVIRVFISSTFRDMHEERERLVKFTLPQLRKMCEERAVAFTEVDLRWGITDEQKSEGKVLPLCLAEIERCRPYFIGMLGERYGWVPDSISQDLVDSQPWLVEHRKHSVTELEIMHGVLRNPAMAERSLFYFRDPKYPASVLAGRRPDFTAEDKESAGKLVRLKERIRDAHRQGRLLEAPRENYPTPEALGDLVLADLTRIIEELYPLDQVPDPLDQEAARHEAYAQSRRIAFIGREEQLRQLRQHLATEGPPLILTGESGSGKSALLAELLARWRQDHPEDLIIQHYTGSTSESADWQGLVRRILTELKRAFQIADALPAEPSALRVALNDWLVKAAGGRRIVLVLDALNQLADDGAARQLGWLPFVFPRNVRVLVSSLAGDTLDALRRPGWSQMVVPLFDRTEIVPAARAYFSLFAKTPPEPMLQALESAPATTNPLYLRAVVDELRQVGEKDKLPECTASYLAAPDLPALFDRILTRWHEDFGRDPEQPDLVRRSLCLIATARFGLLEAELLILLGSEGRPLPRRAWTPFHLAAESALALRAGLLNFGHDYLRAAVRHRWLAEERTIREFRLQIADYFHCLSDPTDRKLDELPALLHDTEMWAELKDLFTDLPIFLRMRGSERWKWEFVRHWIHLGQRFDAGEVYRHALAGWQDAGLPAERFSYVLNEVASFHLDAGVYEPAEPLYRQALEVRERVLGGEHPDTLVSVNNLAHVLYREGDYEGAEPLYRRALAANERVSGREHPSTLLNVNNLALLLYGKGDFMGAESLHRRALEANERVLGKEHPSTLLSLNNLAELLASKGDYIGAESLHRRALEANERVLGKEHPSTLLGVNNLAGLLLRKADYAGAEPLIRRALEAQEGVLGREHPDTLQSLSNLACLLMSKGDYAAAEPLYWRALEANERVLGKDHPSTLQGVGSLAFLLYKKGDYAVAESLHRRAMAANERVLGKDHPSALPSVGGLAELLTSKGDYAGAEPLYRRALEAQERVLGKAHPSTLQIVGGLALLLYRKGDYAGAEPLYRRALEAQERVLGREHPDTLLSVNNLAVLLYGKGDYAGAEALYRRALEASERALGPEHPTTLQCVNNLAVLLYSKGDYAGAEPLIRRALEAKERVLGREHPDTLLSMNNLAALLASKGDYIGAESLHRRALEARERVLGREHPDTLKSVSNLAELLANKGDYAGAKPLYGRALEANELVLGREHPDTLVSVNNLALVLYREGDYKGAEPLYRRALEVNERVLGKEHPNTLASLTNLAYLLASTWDFAGAFRCIGARWWRAIWSWVRSMRTRLDA